MNVEDAKSIHQKLNQVLAQPIVVNDSASSSNNQIPRQSLAEGYQREQPEGRVQAIPVPTPLVESAPAPLEIKESKQETYHASTQGADGPIVNTKPLWQCYNFVKLLGQGRHGDIKMALDKKSKLYVAVRELRRDSLEDVEINTIREEVKLHQMLNQAQHHHIAKLIDFFDSDTELAVVTELCLGGELFHAVIERGAFDEEDARIIIKTLAETIQFMHSFHIAHRDLKLDNILFKHPNNLSSLKLSDFGLAKFIDAKSTQRVITDYCGSPGYVAPETLQQRPVGSAVDLWSLGGFPPFYADNNDDLYRLIRAVNYEYPEEFNMNFLFITFNRYWDGVSAEAKDLIDHLLVFSPQKRYTAEQVLAHAWTKGKVGKGSSRSRDGSKKMELRKKLRKGVVSILALNRVILGGEEISSESAGEPKNF